MVIYNDKVVYLSLLTSKPGLLRSKNRLPFHQTEQERNASHLLRNEGCDPHSDEGLRTECFLVPEQELGSWGGFPQNGQSSLGSWKNSMQGEGDKYHQPLLLKQQPRETGKSVGLYQIANTCGYWEMIPKVVDHNCPAWDGFCAIFRLFVPIDLIARSLPLQGSPPAKAT